MHKIKWRRIVNIKDILINRFKYTEDKKQGIIFYIKILKQKEYGQIFQ